MTATALATRLGISLPSAHKRLDDLGVPRRGRGVPRVVSPEVFAAAVRGSASVPRLAEGLTREAAMVLAALARHPLGLESYRAVARAAGVSPTTVSRVLPKLSAEGLVAHRNRRVARGEAQDVGFWVAEIASPAWRRVAPSVADVKVKPAKPVESTSARVVPHRFHHLFWNAEPTMLSLERNGSYIARRMLTAGEPDAQLWALQNLSEESLRVAQRARGLDKRLVKLVDNVLAERA